MYAVRELITGAKGHMQRHRDTQIQTHTHRCIPPYTQTCIQPYKHTRAQRHSDMIIYIDTHGHIENIDIHTDTHTKAK